MNIGPSKIVRFSPSILRFTIVPVLGFGAVRTTGERRQRIASEREAKTMAELCLGVYATHTFCVLDSTLLCERKLRHSTHSCRPIVENVTLERLDLPLTMMDLRKPGEGLEEE